MEGNTTPVHRKCAINGYRRHGTSKAPHILGLPHNTSSFRPLYSRIKNPGIQRIGIYFNVGQNVVMKKKYSYPCWKSNPCRPARG